MQSCGNPGSEPAKQGLVSAPLLIVTATAGLVSIEARQASLGAVLTELGQRTQIAFTFPEAMKTESVTLSIQRRSVEEVLQQLLIGKSYAVQSRQDGEKKVIAKVDLSAPQGPMVGRASVGSPPSNASPATTGTGKLGPVRTDFELTQLEQSLKESQEPAARLAALNSIANRDTNEAVNPIIVQALSDRAPEVREAALDVLKSSLDPVPISSLTSMAAQDPNPAFRKEAMTLMLDQLGKDEPSQEDIDAVRATLKQGLGDPDPGVREFATLLLADN